MLKQRYDLVDHIARSTEISWDKNNNNTSQIKNKTTFAQRQIRIFEKSKSINQTTKQSIISF
jgi:hypothetical protein